MNDNSFVPVESPFQNWIGSKLAGWQDRLNKSLVGWRIVEWVWQNDVAFEVLVVKRED